MNDIIEYYSQNAERLTKRYEELSPQRIHEPWVHLIPQSKSNILDVGAGSGRDAAWFADFDHSVVAVEPADNLRQKAISEHPDDGILWINDRLPDLKKVHRLNRGFDVIMVSAVWMHLAPSDRPRAFESLHTLLNPAGLLIISFRKGLSPKRPAMYPVAANEIRDLARQVELNVVAEFQSEDMYHRAKVRWQTVVLKRCN
jgi:protein-L-isoaspartate O-methyltransferase